MKYKLLILDIDGTIVKNQSHLPTQRVINAVQKAKKMIHISLCTGRTRQGAMPILNAFQLHNTLHIFEGGAKVVNEKGETEYEKLLDYASVHEIVALGKGYAENIGYCIDGKWMNYETIPTSGNITNVSLNAKNDVQKEKILAHIQPIQHKYHLAIGSHIQHDEGCHIMFSRKDVSKELGIQFVQEKLHITKQETIGMGDMHNDLPIFKRSGLRIAVGGGYEELRDSADYVAPPLSEDPVAHIIEKFIL